jgi:hypothetical protein
MTEHSKIADEFQKAGKDSFEAVARSYGERKQGLPGDCLRVHELFEEGV